MNYQPKAWIQNNRVDQVLFTKMWQIWDRMDLLKEKLKINRQLKCQMSERHPSGDVNWVGG